MPKNAPADDKPTVTFGSGRTQQDGFAFSSQPDSPPDLRLLHYNDVYHLDPSSAEPKGGIARFVTAVNQYRSEDRFRGEPALITLFSGDAFNPSLESSVTKGEHMVPVLNSIGTDCACVGNHDLDFGVKQFEHLARKCNFPWLLANPNDDKLARQTGGLFDLILGGHDHFYAHSFINDTHVLRSGTDFKQLSYIEARRSTTRPGRWDIDILRRDIVSSIPEDAEALRMTSALTDKLKHQLCKPVGWTAAPLDARFSTVRMKESNMGNFVCDIMRNYHHADAALMAAGTIRGDQIYPPGVLRVRDITNCFPFEDPVVVIRVTGTQLREALENSVSMYPAQEGRFPQVSNLEFEFDPSKASGARVNWVKLGGAPLEEEKQYVLATRGYMARGKDGYDSLLVEPEGGTAEELISEENGILISAMLRQYFMGLRTVGQWKNLSEHWVKVASECTTPIETRKNPWATAPGKPEQDGAQPKTSADSKSWSRWMRKRLGLDARPAESDEEEDDSDEKGGKGILQDADELASVDLELLLMRKFFGRWAKKIGVFGKAVDPLVEGDFSVDWTRVIAPVLEGRIKMVSA
ncbi:hypothetical protein BN1708_015266 [Verticillium longisporum]|uniref:5'-Nucleotidase C-terminal domain-containing protein n=1 Tax=Verticillium longisporum TaxID=100787 RepID=A0A0G4M2U5_VERLO|nr:hypothetical protein BN1708_015266 [Verticillium longisporum]